MDLEKEINIVTAYLDKQGMFIAHAEFGKSGNGTANLEFKFNKNDFTHDQVKELLGKFAKKSVTITQMTFVDDALDAQLGTVQLSCNYDFTQELNAEEVEKLSAAKGDSKKLYDVQFWDYTDSRGKKVDLRRTIYKDDKGKYYATQWWDNPTENKREALKGKAKEISKSEADSSNFADYKDKTISPSC